MQLTELGACTLGWPKEDMMRTLYPAVLRACLRDEGGRCSDVSCACKHKELTVIAAPHHFVARSNQGE